MARLRVLCIDIEGGSGGSSRSLLEVLDAVDREKVEPEVWFRRRSAFIERYAAMDIASRVEPEIPSYSTLPRFSRDLFALGRALRGLWRTRRHLGQLAAEIDARFDLVHFNHEGLFLAARWLRRRCRVPFVMHIRTMCWAYGSPFGGWQARAISTATAARVFITENEHDAFRSAGGSDGTVIYNPAAALAPTVVADPRIPKDKRLKVASLSNFHPMRGTDRLIEIAEALAAQNRRDVMFVVAGARTLQMSMTGQLGPAARRGADFADVVAARGLGDMFCFLGHVDTPESVLAECDVLVKPTRQSNPWGRDILEGLAAGKPVVTIGSYDRFVENGVTGFLFDSYDAEAIAASLERLADDPAARRRLGEAGAQRIAALCSPSSRAAELAALWEQAAAS